MELQPGVQLAQKTYCPISGVVFEVKAPLAQREHRGRPLYFCCEACAKHFDANRERIVSMRGY